MEINYKTKDRGRDNQFLSMFAIGIVTALKDNLITCDDAWLWLLNIRTLEKVESGCFNKKVIEAIHLGTELGDVKRLVPHAFEESCNEIIELLKQDLAENTFEELNKYYLEIY